LEGVRGGLLTLVLFVILIALAFQGLGRRLQRVEHAPAQRAMVWALSVALFMHAMNFLAVSYFGQIIMIWFLILGVAGALTPSQVTTEGYYVRTGLPVVAHMRAGVRA
ncbi:MAG TPA: hypothetical protein PLU99_15765, partial [Phycisphaerae bacterium]|nr:hypothetical protein [Phycisphaerae bacterium]